MRRVYSDLVPNSLNPLDYSGIEWENVDVIFEQLGTDYTIPDDGPRMASMELFFRLRKLL